MTDSYRVYETQRANAGRRKIAWRLTFEEWWAVWSASGQWDYHGRSPDGYVLARINPDLGFEPGNVQICTGRAAAQQYWRSPARPRAVAHNRALGERRSRPVSTPQGDYPSVQAAATALGITKGGMNWRLQHWPDRYRYL